MTWASRIALFRVGVDLPKDLHRGPKGVGGEFIGEKLHHARHRDINGDGAKDVAQLVKASPRQRLHAACRSRMPNFAKLGENLRGQRGCC